jgi:NAD(P)-dependent dehydrogenase (short-subunit alcohol dehydrogenase family)
VDRSGQRRSSRAPAAQTADRPVSRWLRPRASGPWSPTPGSARPGPLLDQPLDDLHRRFTLNAVTHLDLVHAFAGRFVARARGGIVLTSALGAFQGPPNMARDSAAKAYVLNLGEALHYELAPAGVDVTVLLPGSVDTPIIDALGLRDAALPIRRSQPTPRSGRPSPHSSGIGRCTSRVARCGS